MKRIIIWFICIFLISWCSFINKKNIEESNSIDVNTFIKEETKKTETSIEKINEEQIEEEKVEWEIEELIDILFETSN